MDLPVLEDLPPLVGTKVLVRVDFNVPIEQGPDGPIVTDAFRIQAAIPTLEYLVEHGADVTCVTHLGRPDGKIDPRFDLAPVRSLLDSLIEGVTLRENLRFDAREEENDPGFVKELVAGFDAFVNDAFGASHRVHASIVGPPQYVPSVAGRLVEQEVRVLSRILHHPERPFVAVVGGSKVADKLGVLRALAGKVDQLLVGGGMAFTFLAAKGHEVGDSLLDVSKIDECQELLSGGAEFLLPSDFVALGPNDEVRHVSADVPERFRGLDIGDESAKLFASAIMHAGTVLWNGPMGVFEDERFASGTQTVAEAVAGSAAYTVVGGGDSVAAIDALGLEDEIDYVSTGGGATLELIEKGDLPGLRALRDAASRWSQSR
ncbi:MAG TPA: phosphoglycerate kinase [Acidimicrobiales bacterium]|jgi:phosphoglycerate kinase|nr:phosphoglycerate kinase [Acidimicrobiales bacterium]